MACIIDLSFLRCTNYTYSFADVNECASQPCSNGAICIDLVNQYQCSCVPETFGEKCEMGKEKQVLSVLCCINSLCKLHKEACRIK